RVAIFWSATWGCPYAAHGSGCSLSIKQRLTRHWSRHATAMRPPCDRQMRLTQKPSGFPSLMIYKLFRCGKATAEGNGLSVGAM
ncbi:MAG: hypothetical protein MR567_03440, partial [Oscillospiraceae bacterium]|nr:hypothetical protein [Oscillospiraceae bacterium]